MDLYLRESGMKRAFIITLCAMALLNGCASIDKGAMIGLIESVVVASMDYLREHPETIRPLSSDASADGSSVDASLD